MPKTSVKILNQDDKRLRQISQDVPLAEINTPKIAKLISDMNVALDSQEDGVAIAAPQIGINLRVFIVSGKVFDSLQKNKPKKLTPNQIYINPQIIKTSKKKVPKTGEGCLSVRWLYGTVMRYANVTLSYYDENGVQQSRGAGGLLAHIFQHEIDHLDGVLFIDKATMVEEILPEDVSREVEPLQK